MKKLNGFPEYIDIKIKEIRDKIEILKDKLREIRKEGIKKSGSNDLAKVNFVVCDRCCQLKYKILIVKLDHLFLCKACYNLSRTVNVKKEQSVEAREERLDQKRKERQKRLEKEDRQIKERFIIDQIERLKNQEQEIIKRENNERRKLKKNNEEISGYGYVYICINASLEKNILKIGKTNRNPTVRAKELSDQTGLPSEFIVAYDREVSDCEKAEIMIHNKLKKYRLTEFRKDRDREFFRVPLKDAIRTIDEIVMEIDSF